MPDQQFPPLPSLLIGHAVGSAGAHRESGIRSACGLAPLRLRSCYSWGIPSGCYPYSVESPWHRGNCCSRTCASAVKGSTLRVRSLQSLAQPLTAHMLRLCIQPFQCSRQNLLCVKAASLYSENAPRFALTRKFLPAVVVFKAGDGFCPEFSRRGGECDASLPRARLRPDHH